MQCLMTCLILACFVAFLVNLHEAKRPRRNENKMVESNQNVNELWKRRNRARNFRRTNIYNTKKSRRRKLYRNNKTKKEKSRTKRRRNRDKHGLITKKNGGTVSGKVKPFKKSRKSKKNNKMFRKGERAKIRKRGKSKSKKNNKMFRKGEKAKIRKRGKSKNKRTKKRQGKRKRNGNKYNTKNSKNKRTKKKQGIGKRKGKKYNNKKSKNKKNRNKQNKWTKKGKKKNRNKHSKNKKNKKKNDKWKRKGKKNNNRHSQNNKRKNLPDDDNKLYVIDNERRREDVPSVDDELYVANYTYPVPGPGHPPIIVNKKENIAGSVQDYDLDIRYMPYYGIRVFQYKFRKGGSVYYRDETFHRCWDTKKHCVAKWNHDCLYKTYNGTLLKILESKNWTVRGEPCLPWRRTHWAKYSDAVENRCKKKFEGRFEEKPIPYCHVSGNEDRIAYCFPTCNQDITTVVIGLTANRPITRLKRYPRGEVAFQSTDDGEINIWEIGNDDTKMSTVKRCYDQSNNCISYVNGSCVFDSFPNDIATVLNNANATVNGEPCISWNTAQHHSARIVPDTNLCRMPVNSPWNGDGPWCHTASGYFGHGPCFKSCESLGSEKENTSFWDNPQNWISYSTGPHYPLLDMRNRVIRLKLKTTIRHRFNYAILNLHLDGRIKVTQFVVNVNRTAGNSFVDTVDEVEIRRCFNPVKRCVARWSGLCLSDFFSGIVLDILSTETHTVNGDRCDFWNTTSIQGFSGLEGNHCKLSSEAITSREPFCVAGGTKANCFPLCNIDFAKQTLGPDNRVITVPFPDNKRITLRYISRQKISIVGDFPYLKKNETLTRCYDKTYKCVAQLNGSCLKVRYIEDVYTILMNNVYTRFGTKCTDWSTLPLFTYGYENAHNLCNTPKESHHPQSVNGPFCAISARGDWESCYDDCAKYGLDHTSASTTPQSKLSDCDKRFRFTSCDVQNGTSLETKTREAARAGCKIFVFPDGCSGKDILSVRFYVPI